MGRRGDTKTQMEEETGRLIAAYAKERFWCFMPYVNPAYDPQWFHRYIADSCQRLYEGKIKKLMIFVPPQHGKQLADSTTVPTPQGMRRHGDLKPGDYVFGRHGEPVGVVAVSAKTQSEYVVAFTDGTEVQCHGNHEWVVYNRSLRGYRIYETRQLAGLTLETGKKGRRGHRYVMQVDAPVEVEYPYQPVDIDPYTLGAWLGDGVTEWPKIHIGCGDMEIVDAIPYEVNEGSGTTDRVFYIHGVSRQFKRYGLLGNKHIPDEYIHNSAEVRKQLIAGLIDTDGSVYARNGRVTISNTNENVIEGAACVLRSLGQTVTVCSFAPAVSSSGIEGRKVCYQLSFNPTMDFPTKVARKRTVRLVKPRRRGIVSVERKSGLEWGNCIQVEGGVYLIGRNYIPTHNSEIVSRCFPAWCLGKNPDTKIVGCSYSADLVQQFSRSIQRTIDSEEYRYIFPATYLNGANLRTVVKGYLRNVDLFETVGHKGFYKAVGVGGSLTGTPVDIGIIDDPVKDAVEAYSVTYRERVWEWYTAVFLTRLHNESKQLLIMTRWHEDDLAGRLLDREGDSWEVVSIPAICEEEGKPRDPRKVGDALWPERHSLERLKEVEKRSPRTFDALYQQRPTVQGGNIIKRDWFGHVSVAEFNRMYHNEPMVFFLDTAYTSKQSNDPTGIISTCKIGADLYITHAEKVLMKFPDLIRHIVPYVKAHGYSTRSTIRIEPKANGLSVIDELKDKTGLNVTQTPSPKDDKETRLNVASPSVECGRVILVDGPWNEAFIDEVCGFPAKPHDEYVDVLCYAVDFHLDNPFKPIDKARLSRIVH